MEEKLSSRETLTAVSYVGFIYEFTNLVNGKKYIGSHLGTEDDGYFGSGIYWSRAVKKYGKSSFTRRILEYVYDPKFILPIEQKHLDETQAAYREDYYNTSPTAGGGLLVTDTSVFSENNKKNWKDPIVRAKRSIGISRSKLGKPAKNRGVSMSESQKEKLRDEWLIKTPDETIIVVSDFSSFCKINNLNASAMSAVARGNRRHHKGYVCKKLTPTRGYIFKPWKSKGTGGKIFTGSENRASKQVTINGQKFSCISDAMKATGMSRYLIKRIGIFNG